MDLTKKIALVRQLAWREIETRYRGSILGVLWSFITPLFMLMVFTFVFTIVFQSRWSQTNGGTLDFAVIIFAGLTTFTLFSEVVGRSPDLVINKPNLVKKVVFPLEILPIVAMMTALFQAVISLAILLVFQLVLGSGWHTTALAVPVLVLPLCFLTLGVAWFLAALGVYVRDIGQIVPTLITALMFLSPIFYPSANLPEWMRPIAAYSPLGYSVETVRDALVFGHLPQLGVWLAGLFGGLLVAALGYVFFQKTRKGFADVL